MQKWEYNFVVSTYFESHKEGVLNPIGWRNHSDLWEVKDSNGKTTLELLNEYGKWGWEIVSCVPFYDALQASYNPSHYIFVLKRPIIEAGRPTQTETTTPDQAEKKAGPEPSGSAGRKM